MLLTKKKRFIVGVMVCVAVLAMVVAGCGENQNAAEPTGDELSGSITIAGSTSVQSLSEVLAERFMELHPNVRINVQGGGSTAGVQAATTGTAEMGASSRELKESEKGLNEFMVCRDGIAIVVNPENKVTNLTLAQVKKIYLGKIKNWQEVGGDDAEIHVVSREEGSGTRGAFEELVMEKEAAIDTATIQNSTGAVATYVAGDKNSIGYVSLTGLSDRVNSITIEGAEATTEEIKDGSYKVARPFLYLTKEEPAGLVKEYFDFVVSEEGTKIIEEEGLVAVQ